MSPDLTRVPPPGRLGLLRGLERSSSSPNRPRRISNPVHRASEQSHARVEGSGILRLNRGCSLRQLFVQAPNQVDAPVHGREAPPAAGARWEAHYEVVWSGAGGWRGPRADSFTPSPSAHLLTPPFPSSPPTTTHMRASPAGPSVSGLPLRLGRLVLGTLE